MPKKCESCLFFLPSRGDAFEDGRCDSPSLIIEHGLDYLPEIYVARELCDKEGDGHFVYFEPLPPSATGAAFARRNTTGRVCALAAGGAA